MEAKRQTLEHGFGPFYRPDSVVLILGSFPSVKSREAAFFYGHPQNRFWPLLAHLCGEGTPCTREEKTVLLERHGVALYDVIERCSIIGSADSTIRDVVPADLRPILEESHVEDRIFVNGGTAARLYEKYLLPNFGIAARRLPSTSPANAAWSFERLLAAWGKELNPVLGGVHDNTRML